MGPDGFSGIYWRGKLHHHHRHHHHHHHNHHHHHYYHEHDYRLHHHHHHHHCHHHYYHDHDNCLHLHHHHHHHHHRHHHYYHDHHNGPAVNSPIQSAHILGIMQYSKTQSVLNNYVNFWRCLNHKNLKKITKPEISPNWNATQTKMLSEMKSQKKIKCQKNWLATKKLS